MESVKHSRLVVVCFTLVLVLPAACTKEKQQPLDHPRLTPKVTMRDVIFHSVSLNRDIPYRVVLPVIIGAGQRLPVVYLLHGIGGDFRDWSNYSDVARFAEHGLILVMPEGQSSYYTNSVDRPQDRYEDYIVSDLISDVEDKFPIAAGRPNRAIAGISMGGFGAVKLSLRHPELFAFAAGISAAIDVPRRPFSIKRFQQSRHYNSIFGPPGSQTRHDNDPFVLARSVDPGKMPYLFLTCGEKEGLLGPTREFTALLAQRHFRYEFHSAPGGHDWTQWNEQLPSLFQNLEAYINSKAKSKGLTYPCASLSELENIHLRSSSSAQAARATQSASKLVR
jgi:putative tributyrin esterase